LQPGGNIHPVAEHITVALDDVPGMDTDADVDLLGCLFLGVVGLELGVNLLGTLYGVDDGGKVYQKGIPDRFDDRAMMRRHGLLNKLIVEVEQAQHAGFIRAHLSTKAHYIGEHDGRQLACFGSTYLVAVHYASFFS
jgi:hypothetical protein